MSGNGIKRYNVVLDNSVVLGSYWLSVSEKVCLYILLAKVDQSKLISGDWQTVTIKDYMDVRGVNYSTALDALMVAYDNLFDRTIKIKTEEGKEEHRWIISKRWDNVNKEFSVKWHPDIVKYLCELANYSTMCLNESCEFKSVYTFRLYQLLSMHRYRGKQGSISIKLDDFLDMIQSKDCYKEFKYLNRYVLQSSIKELEERELCKVELETVRVGRKVGELVFNYSWK